jgi:Xaa-Pro aminopeptidase
MADFSIQREKLAQAVDILRELDLDCWITFVRETLHNADPALGLVLGVNMTWQAAFIITQSGEKIAIVGRYDTDSVKESGAYDEIIGYDQSIQPDLIRVLERIAPRQIALNYSESDSAADGLAHGMFLTLQRYFEGKPWQIVSAEMLLNKLRGRKTSSEVARIRAAIALTEKVIDSVTGMLRPGLSEKEISQFVHGEFKKAGVVPSWDENYCPTVTVGPDSPVGHTPASDQYRTQPGYLVRIDLGVILDHYISDIQRVWYLQPKDEAEIPYPVRHAFDSVRGAILAAAEVLKPGVKGHVVDDAARAYITEMGYPEYKHAVGHGIGRTVHDGSTLLGPRWERYGNSPEGIVEVGNCYTLELGVHVSGYGLVSLEEDVMVTENGLEWLGNPQTDLIVVKV